MFSAGDSLGEYELIESLGAGGMGAVFKVRHRISHRIEALKIILPDRSDPSSDERFLREIRVLAALKHVNIGSFYNAFRAGDKFAMVMEFIEGASLRAILAGTRLSIEQALSYGGQILAALVYAHSCGVIHRDVKPSNVMIQRDGVLKLLDFGLATSQRDVDLTQSGAVLGSPYYMSPEQARGEKADSRSDLYSTGAVLYEMACGRPPFDRSGTYAIIAAHLNDRPQPLREINPNIPAVLSDVVMRSLAKHPAERFQTAQDFLSALQAVQSETQETILQPVVSTPRPPSEKPLKSEASKLTQPEMDQASKDLASYIGPIAQIVVKRAAAQSRTVQELYQRVSEEIGSASQRQEFLNKMPLKSVSRSAF